MKSETEFYNRLASTIKAHRKKAGLSQKELADFANVGKTVVYDIEHGKPTVKICTLYKILSVLNIKLTLQSTLLSSEHVNTETHSLFNEEG